MASNLLLLLLQQSIQSHNALKLTKPRCLQLNCPFCAGELEPESQEQIWNGASFTVRTNYQCANCELTFPDQYLRSHKGYTED